MPKCPKTILIPDGYSGDTVRVCCTPLERRRGSVHGNTIIMGSVKLHVAEPGREYLIAWISEDEWLRRCRGYRGDYTETITESTENEE